MTTTLDAIVTDGRLIVSFPEDSVSPEARERFVSQMKVEWALLQSRFTNSDAQEIADEIDQGWWAQNRTRILAAIGEK
jgi:hypothetical protein